MKTKPDRPPQPTTPHHEGGDPASPEQDPAPFYPAGGAGLLHPENDRLRDTGPPQRSEASFASAANAPANSRTAAA